MADIPTITSPTDGSTVDPPFSIQGGSTALLVEARGENGLLLPATQNPVVPSAGSYTIAGITSLIGTYNAGYAVLGGTVEVPSGGISDDFTGTDGALGTNWEKPAGEYATWVRSSNTAVPASAVGDNHTARWNGATALGADRFVIARMGYGITNYGARLFAKAPSTWSPSGARAEVESKLDGDGVTQTKVFLVRGTAGANLFQGVSSTDSWVKMIISGHVLVFYTSANGSAWTYRGALSAPGIEALTGQPTLFAGSGLSTGTAAQIFVDDFSGDTLSATSNANLLTRAVAVNVGVTGQGWTIVSGTPTITAGQTDPNGGTEGVKATVTGGSNVLAAPQLTGLTTGTRYMMSVWIRRTDAVNIGAVTLQADFPTNADVSRYMSGTSHLPVDVYVRHAISWVQGSDTAVTPRIIMDDGAAAFDFWGLKVEASDYPSGTAASI